ncbi:LacI family transcriptional regulator [Halosquirtibacter xylanolyticus]|uniref:LacI family DNA-binding transcriptional regulator n=1 Tax=Halosquirtibacter xylanolyticus TaxID=3374599 RepID=UPI003748420A|nr:LacI family transcriptional regulator [Prolixibacteraceae bacterium]
MEQNITIHDIAKKLGISSSTVSRALNNNSRISDKTKAKVLELANELGYKPNAAATALRMKRTKTIGLIIPKINRHFFSDAINGVEKYAKSKGYNVIITQSNESEAQEKECIQTLLHAGVDGIIASIALVKNDYQHYYKIIDREVPLVFFDRICDEIESNKVVVDDFKGGFLAAEHLISQGCKQIAHIAGPQHLNLYINRTQGFFKALRKHNMEPFASEILENYLTREEGEEAAKILLGGKKRPDAIFASNDTVCLSLIEYAKQHNIAIPDELAIIGFSNEPYAKLISPSLSTIEQRGYDVGYKATELLITNIDNQTNTHETIVLPIKLIERESSAKKKK